MVRRAEWAFGTLDCFLAAADGRPDADDLEPFAVRQRRQNGGEALGHHALARAGRPGKQDVVSARGGDLKRTLDRMLAHDMCKVERAVLRLGRRRRGTGRERHAAAQMGEQIAQAGNRKNANAGSVASLRRVLRGNIYRAKTCVPRGERHGKRAAHRTQLPGKRKLPQKHSILRERVDLTRRSENGQQDGQVVSGTRLFGICGGKVDRQAGDRPVEGTCLRGGTHAFTCFGHRAGRQTDHVQPRQAAGQKAFDGDNITVDAAESGRKHARYHPIPP